MDFNRYLRGMTGCNRYDLTHLLAQPEAFPGLVEALAAPFANDGISKVAGLDAMGLGLAGGVAHRLGAGLVHVRKGGRIAWNVEAVTFTDYTGTQKTLEIAADAVSDADRVVIVDDWSETGAQLKAAVTLIERLGAQVVGAACLHIEPQARGDAALRHLRLSSVMAI